MPSAKAAMNQAVIGPHETATTCPMSKNVCSAADRVDRSSASSEIIVSTAFSPVSRSVSSERRSGVSRAVWYG